MASQTVSVPDILPFAQAALVRLKPLIADHARLNADITRQNAIKDQLAILAETQERIRRNKEELEELDAEIKAEAVPGRKQSKGGFRTLAERQAALKAKMLGTSVAADTKEIPFTVEVAAPYWGQSPKATREHFRDLPGVRVIPSPPSYIGGRRKRAYETVLIPPSVLLREIDKSTKKSPKRGG